MSQEAEDDAGLGEVAELFGLLATPVRCGIVLHLADGPKPVHELVAALGVSQTLMSQHLRVLRMARLVTADRQGREVFYDLTDHHVSHIVRDALEHTKEQR
jgi:DNA-binding transcriptional ArsR family regulator